MGKLDFAFSENILVGVDFIVVDSVWYSVV